MRSSQLDNPFPFEYAPGMSDTMAILGETSWTRMSEGIEKVKDRLRRATSLLEAAGVPYAVIGGNAVAAWVSRVDDSVVRNTRDVDLLVRRADMDAIISAMTAGGFIHRSASILGGKGRIEMFLDGPGAKARDRVHLIFSGEKVNSDSPEPSPDVADIDETHADFRLLDLEALITMKLTSYRDKDRLQELLDDPDG
jgi:hypothetical protein